MDCRFGLLLGAWCWAATLQAQPQVREGDIIFQQSRSAQSAAVQQATGSRYSHMGLVLYRDGQKTLFEAAARVQFTPLSQWIARGEGGRYVVKRLQDAGPLDAAALRRMHAQAEALLGRRYDLTFEWSDERLYCSELVWKVYERSLGLRIGELQRIRDFNLAAPAVRIKLRERYGNQVPLDETVVSPVAMFESPLLRPVAQD